MNEFVSLNGEGDFVFYVADEEASRFHFDGTQKEAIEFDLKDFLEENQNLLEHGKTITFRLALENVEGARNDYKLSSAITVKYYDENPPSASNKINFAVEQRFNGELGSMDNGDVYEYGFTLNNLESENGQGMTVAIFRVPSCLAVNFQQLEGMKDTGLFDMYEVLNDNTEIVLYWRQMKPAEEKTWAFQLQQAYETGGNCM